MSLESVRDPGVLTGFEVDAGEPSPVECLPRGEEPLVAVDLSPGWVAVTDRQVVAYRPDRTPPVRRLDRPNLTGVAVKRAGGGAFLQYVPHASAYAFGALLSGFGLLTVDPRSYVSVPDGPSGDRLTGLADALGWTFDMLGVALVFTGILAILVAGAVLTHWLLSREVTLVVERGDAEPIECPTTRPAGVRAVDALREVLVPAGDEDDIDGGPGWGPSRPRSLTDDRGVSDATSLAVLLAVALALTGTVAFAAFVGAG